MTWGVHVSSCAAFSNIRRQRFARTGFPPIADLLNCRRHRDGSTTVSNTPDGGAVWFYNLAAMLSELGPREEAARAAPQATDLYRGLAQVRPQTIIRPDLERIAQKLAAILSQRASDGDSSMGGPR
jgi:hypothetical protein